MSGKFEKLLWNVRYITILSVILSIIAAFTLIILGSWDIIEAVIFIIHFLMNLFLIITIYYLKLFQQLIYS